MTLVTRRRGPVTRYAGSLSRFALWGQTDDVFSRIVVGYDDSPGARLALRAAIDLARATGGRVTAVAVEAHLPHYGATVGEVDEEREIEEQACRRWLKAAEAYAAERDVKIGTEIRAGHAAHQLVKAAEAHHADLLVLGQRGHSALWGRLIGTTAERVGRQAVCSVLIMRDGPGEDAQPDP